MNKNNIEKVLKNLQKVKESVIMGDKDLGEIILDDNGAVDPCKLRQLMEECEYALEVIQTVHSEFVEEEEE